MTFDELRSMLRAEAAQGGGCVRAVEAVGLASLRVEMETVPGRSHGVWLAQEMSADGETLRIIAPAARIPKGRELTPDAARALLRRNAQLSAGALALVSLDGDEHIALSVPLLLTEVDAPRALLAMLRAANAADAFEETQGDGDDL
jgi:hypothetical protein